MKDSNVRRLSALHRFVFKLTRGRLGSRLVDNDVLLLTTVGETTGREHEVPLLYLSNGGSFVVVASYGGRSEHPQWYENLLAEPEAKVQIGTETVAVRSRTATSEERSLLWARVVEAYEGYQVYQSRTDREIAIVILEPT